MLKKLRILVSVMVFCLLGLYFLDIAGILPAWVGGLAEAQFVPALLALNFAVLGGLLAVALVFGRVYCSSLCPLGTLQDIASRCFRKKMSYRKSNTVLRLLVLVLCLAVFNALAILDPYSIFGRITVHLFRPVYIWGNNLLAVLFNYFGNYTFYHYSVEVLSVFSLVLASIFFIAICVFGRLYCNTICPVGTVLGFANKIALFKIRMDKSKCVSCGLCEKKCKASCIDANAKTLDYSRCVNCFNCIENCKGKGISYGRK